MKTTTIELTVGNRNELAEVQKWLKNTRNVNPSANDAVSHLIRFWKQKKGKGSE